MSSAIALANELIKMREVMHRLRTPQIPLAIYLANIYSIIDRKESIIEDPFIAYHNRIGLLRLEGLIPRGRDSLITTKDKVDPEDLPYLRKAYELFKKRQMKKKSMNYLYLKEGSPWHKARFRLLRGQKPWILYSDILEQVKELSPVPVES